MCKVQVLSVLGVEGLVVLHYYKVAHTAMLVAEGLHSRAHSLSGSITSNLILLSS